MNNEDNTQLKLLDKEIKLQESVVEKSRIAISQAKLDLRTQILRLKVLEGEREVLLIEIPQ